MSRLSTIDLPRGDQRLPVRVVLRGGEVAELRPLTDGETAPLLAVFEGMSPESRALRYLTGLPRLPASMVAAMCAVDGDRHVAWLASIAGEPAGIGRYVRIPGRPAAAELAFEVVDRHHGRGVATVLLDVVTTVAAARRIRHVTGTVAASNTAARRLLERVGVSVRRDGGLLEGEGPLRLLDPSVVDRAAVLDLACRGCWDRELEIG